MASASGKRTISTEVSEDFIERLDERARAESRSRSAVIARFLEFGLTYAPVQADEIPSPMKAVKERTK